MISKHLIPILEHKEPIEFAEKQMKVFWLPDEINVEKDVQDVLVNFTESERHGVITVLKLFSLYETSAGSEYWGNRFRKMFEGSEFHRMASVFSMVELAIHGPFYNKINELLHINTENFYLSYKDVPVLNERMKFIGDVINDPDDLVSLAAFSMVEGAILYSSFAYLKHFQSQGKNKLMNIVRGISFSLRDENLHSLAGAWSFKHKLSQSNLNEERWLALTAKIKTLAETILEHEKEIINIIFEKGTMDGITKNQMNKFVESRLDECLKQLGMQPVFNPTSNPIADWFYKGINDYQFNDFFSGISNNYHRNWDETRFTWKKAAE